MPYSQLNSVNLSKTKLACFFTPDRKVMQNNILVTCLIRDAIERNARFANGFAITHSYIEISRIRSSSNVKLFVGYSKTTRKFYESKVKEFILGLINPIKEKTNIDILELEISETERPMHHALYVAQQVERDLRRNISVRKLTRVANNCINGGALGCAIEIKGRINGYEISRKDKVLKGSLKRSSFCSDISYIQYVAVCKSGCIGVKVWVNRGQHK